MKKEKQWLLIKKKKKKEAFSWQSVKFYLFLQTVIN